MAGRSLLIDLALRVAGVADLDKATAGIERAGKLADVGQSSLKLLGVAGAAGFGMIALGSQTAEAAQGKFMAATGKSRAEAEKFVSSMDGLAGTAGSVGLSMGQIYDAGTQVANQFGTTGQRTTDLTADFLDFARANNQQVGPAIQGINDLLTAFGEPTEKATDDLDLLTASHQKFGTDVGPATIETLRNMSPALQALGADFEDGVGLLNAFETAGLDATTAQRGLNTAVKDLPPGTTLDDLIAQLGAIEDPAERSQKAIELFGAKAGLGLAQVIKPGMTSLDDFQVSMDDARGATAKAAEDMQTDGDKIRGILQKIGAGATELGQAFGPALSGIAASVSLLAPALKGGWDQIAGSQIAKDAGAKVGAVIGAAMATATQLAATGAEALGSLGAKIAAMSIPLAGAGTTVGTAVGGAIAVGVSVGWLAALAGPVAATLNVSAILDHLTGSDTTSKLASAGRLLADQFVTGYSDQVKAEYARRAQDAYNAALAAGGSYDVAAQAGKDAGDAFLAGQHSQIEALAADDAREALAQSGIVATFADDPTIAAAGKAAVRNMAESMRMAAGPGMREFADSMAKEAHVAGAATDAALAESLLKSRGQVTDAFEQFVADMKHPMTAMREIAQLQGELSSKALRDGLASNDPLIRQQAIDMRDAITSRLNDLNALMRNQGKSAVVDLAAAMQAEADRAAAAAGRIVDRINAELRQINSNVKITVDAHGEYVGHGGNPGTHALGGRAWAGMPTWVGERGRRELFVPDVNGTIMANPSMGGGAPIVINVTAGVGDPVEIGRSVSEALRAYQRASGAA